MTPSAPMSVAFCTSPSVDVRHPDEGNRRRPLARHDHPRDVLVGQRRVLHLDPREIEAGVGHRAVQVGIGELDLGAADDLFALGELLLDGVVEAGCDSRLPSEIR